MVKIQNKYIPLVSLGAVLRLNNKISQQSQYPIVVLNFADQKVAFKVDDIIRQEQATIKPLGSFLKRQKYIMGASILGGNTIALILDIGGLVVPQVHPLLKHHTPEELANIYPALDSPLPKADYIVYRSKRPNEVEALTKYYEPLFTKSVASLGISADPGVTYYTVCRIHWDQRNGEEQ